MEEALEASRACAVFLGAQLGPWQNEEMRAALSKRVHDADFRVIPVLLPGAAKPGKKDLMPFLRRLTWVDLSSGLDDEDAYHRRVEETRDLSQALGVAYRQRAMLVAEGQEPTDITETILDLRCKIGERYQAFLGVSTW